MPWRAAGTKACLILLLPICLTAVCGGCAGTAVRECVADLDLLYAAPGDSAAIDPFLALDAATQAARRADAEDARRKANRTKEPDERIRLMSRAARAAPDDPDLWLGAASAWRAVGDQLQTGAALGGAAAAVRRLNDPSSPLSARGEGYRQAAALATALARAWHHYERADWNAANDWALTAQQIAPSSESALEIRGLIEGRLGHTTRVTEVTDELRRLDVFNPYPRWIQSAHDESLDRLRGALGEVLDLRPLADRALECYRDMGALAERLDEWTLADEWYRQSAAASPLAGHPCFRRLDLPGLEPGAGGGPARQVQVWLAMDRHYVTGSFSAYTRHAFTQFDSASPGPDRDLWAGLAVNAAGIHLRRFPGDPWALRVRGLVFAATGKADLARDDLRRASAAFADAQLGADARVEAELGRLLLERDDVSAALPRLRRAVELDPAAAAPWGDLGMALASAGDAKGALAALTRAIELAPERPTAWYNRGLLHMNAHRFEEAGKDLARAAELAPDNADIARLLQQLRRAQTQPK